MQLIGPDSSEPVKKQHHQLPSCPYQ
ncbi:hypothetical protein DSM3645_02928 [Blastopirellula marina DSM 3645]|uniref:Uncharacterized protein n=1 Tax=Blastopirellula marina DSM 3645 TaxID=314230 RepID=A3ZVP9_9BACT|nr:hypothetical protein DSM3645_02928 [Blastopirellula marina DSM 3645]